MSCANKRRIAVLLVAIMLATPAFAALSDPGKDPKKPRLTEEQRIVHVLNRLGYGARPGDVERVKAMGLENYINRQLNPGTIDDTVAENKIKDLISINMTTAEL